MKSSFMNMFRKEAILMLLLFPSLMAIGLFAALVDPGLFRASYSPEFKEIKSGDQLAKFIQRKASELPLFGKDGRGKIL